MTTLIGTNPDQVPVNSMLGGMAYQDPDSISVKDLNYSGTITGGTGVINIGSSQIYKDSGGNVGIGNSPVSNGKTLTLVNTSTGNSSFYLQNSTTGFTATDGTLLQLSGSVASLWNFENSNLSLATNNTEFVRLTGTGDIFNLGTGATKLQEGTTAQRPSFPLEGMIRKNSTLGVIEGYSEGGYVSLEAGRLINVRLFTTHSTHSSFTLDTKTKYIVVELIGGGGGAGTKASGPYGADLQVSIGGSGGNASGVKFLIKNNLQSTYYYYIGDGGAAGTGSLSSGNDGSDSFFSTSPTSVAFTNYIKASGGIKGTTAAPASPPVSLYGGQQGAYVIAGSLTSDAVIMEAGGAPGYRLTMVSASNAGLVLSGTPRYLLYTHHPLSWASAQADLISPTVLSFGAGGSGAVGYRNDSGISSYSQSSYAGFQGMMRVYEYS